MISTWLLAGLAVFLYVGKDLRGLLLLCAMASVFANYESTEAHKHSHEAVNMIAEMQNRGPVFNEDGGRIGE